MIASDRELLSRLGRINQNFGLAVLELLHRLDGGDLPADGLRALADRLEEAVRACRKRADEIDGGARTIDAAEHVMLLNGQADQAM